MIDSENAQKMRARDETELDKVAEDARAFRKWLRTLVISKMGKRFQAKASALAPLNDLLALENGYSQIELVRPRKGDTPHAILRRIPRWETAQELLQPLAEAAADLICHQDFQLIRACEGTGCILVFLDRTRAHSRRWCSMAICGNRAKVAAHRAKQAKKEGS